MKKKPDTNPAECTAARVIRPTAVSTVSAAGYTRYQVCAYGLLRYFVSVSLMVGLIMIAQGIIACMRATPGKTLPAKKND